MKTLKKRILIIGLLTIALTSLSVSQANSLSITNEAIYMNNNPIVDLPQMDPDEDHPSQQAATVGYADERLDDVVIEGEEYVYSEIGFGTKEELGGPSDEERDFHRVPVGSPDGE